MRRLPVALVFLLAAAAGGEEPPILHEHVPPPQGDKGARVVGERGADANPSAIRTGARVLPEPARTEPQRPEEPLHAPGPGAAEARPDYQTQADATLHYAEVFNPSVVPFKRSQVLDAVRPDYTLYVAQPALEPLKVGGRARTDHDLFWASLVVEIEPGQATAIPSVAPDMRILSYEADPPAKLAFAKDGADNFFVRADPATKGVFRLVFLADAPASYFAAQVPSGITLDRLSGARPVPPSMRDAALRVLSLVGVSRRDRLDEALAKLVRYFRAFEAGNPPSPTGDVYLDLAYSKRGVCRHRAFAFVVTANAAGIPARYVTNEAHAFVEVRVPDRGWVRVDLGGAASELDVANAGDKSMYRPRAPDPFPRPARYAENYTRLRGDVRGLSRDQLAEADRAAEEGSPADPRSTAPVVPAPGADLPRLAPAPGKPAARVTLDGAGRRVFRGEPLAVAGRVTDGSTGVAGVRVNLFLAPAGAGGRGARQVGETVTDGSGAFRGSLILPADFPLGDHELFAATPGNDAVGPGLSE
jgi:transglutaminase-like putative cysteine protease